MILSIAIIIGTAEGIAREFRTRADLTQVPIDLFHAANSYRISTTPDVENPDTLTIAARINNERALQPDGHLFCQYRDGRTFSSA
jgi:hypothetical protein